MMFLSFIIGCLVTFPLTHILMKKSMVLDYNLTKVGVKKLNTFFYIPFLNVIIGLLYLIWVVIKFKRPG